MLVRNPTPDLDEATHIYTVEARQLISSTQILHRAGIVDDRFYTEYGRDRGSLVHTTLEYEDRGELDEATLDPRLRPYLDAYRQFKHEAGVEAWDGIELRLADLTKGYAGTIDRLGAFGLLDFKSGTPEPWIRLQLALYAMLAEANGLIPSARRVKRWGLFLRSDGTYRLEPYTDPQDFAVADAARIVAQWRDAHVRAA